MHLDVWWRVYVSVQITSLYAYNGSDEASHSHGETEASSPAQLVSVISW